MSRRVQVKKEDPDYMNSSDGDEPADEEDRAARRRARNREAARRVRERRLNAIATLTEQVEALTAENAELHERIKQLQAASLSAETNTSSPSDSGMGGGTTSTEAPQGPLTPSERPETQEAAVQTDPIPESPATPATAPAGTMTPMVQSLQGQLHTLQQQLLQQQTQSGTPASTPQGAGTMQPGLNMVNLQQMQMMLQIQMQMLQLQSASGTSSPAMQHTAGAMPSPSVPSALPSSGNMQQLQGTAATAIAATSSTPAAWNVSASPSSSAGASGDVQAAWNPATVGNEAAAQSWQASPATPAAAAQPWDASTAASQQTAQLQPPQQQQPLTGGNWSYPSYTANQKPAKRQQQAMQQQSQPQYAQQQLSLPPQQVVIKQEQAQQQQPVVQQRRSLEQQQVQPSNITSAVHQLLFGRSQHQLPTLQLPQQQQQQVAPTLPQQVTNPTAVPATAAAPVAAAAALAPDGPVTSPGDDPRFRPIPDVLCQLDEDHVLMSTDINTADLNLNSNTLNLNTAEMNALPADMNLSTSGFNALMMSDDLLRHVPTPEEATASRSTAWL